MFSPLLRSICEHFFFRERNMYAGKREKERNSAHGRKQNGLTRIFAHHSETLFDLPLSCIGFSSSAWKGRTPLNQHHLLRLCIRVRSLRIPSSSSSSSLAPSSACSPPCSVHGQGRLRNHGNNGQGQRSSF